MQHFPVGGGGRWPPSPPGMVPSAAMSTSYKVPAVVQDACVRLPLMENGPFLSCDTKSRAGLLARPSSLPCPSWQRCFFCTCSGDAWEESANDDFGTKALSGTILRDSSFPCRAQLCTLWVSL